MCLFTGAKWAWRQLSEKGARVEVVRRLVEAFPKVFFLLSLKAESYFYF